MPIPLYAPPALRSSHDPNPFDQTVPRPRLRILVDEPLRSGPVDGEGEFHGSPFVAARIVDYVLRLGSRGVYGWQNVSVKKGGWQSRLQTQAKALYELTKDGSEMQRSLPGAAIAAKQRAQRSARPYA